ncbi:MAG: hypothetical protein GY944_17760 [bacterium]|nr:hypothetical protein [bacterium]
MDPRVLYWTFAFINMGFVIGLAVFGTREILHGHPTRHRVMMIASAGLVVAFIVSYAFKLQFLGREDLSAWSARDINVLRFHETCVLAMVVGGGLALLLGHRLRATRRFTLDVEDPRPDPVLVRRHRLAGRVAIVGAALGFVSAGFVLAGMYARLG